MRVQDAMTKKVQTVDRQSSVAEAARIMRYANVGILPVIGSTGLPVGVITDRDIALCTLVDGLAPPLR